MTDDKLARITEIRLRLSSPYYRPAWYDIGWLCDELSVALAPLPAQPTPTGEALRLAGQQLVWQIEAEGGHGFPVHGLVEKLKAALGEVENGK